MNTLMKRAFASIVMALAAAPAVLAAQFDGMVDVGPNKLHVVQMGEGPYTVVFEAGFGSDMGAWRKVAPEIAKKAKVLVYSRAGLGQSPARQYGMPLEESAAEFEQMLAAVKATGPFILVGHSYGAFLIRTYAARHPADVAGMVFVDPADEGIETVLKRLDDKRVAIDRRALLLMTPPAMQDDLRLIQQIMYKGSLPAMAALPDVPAVVLTSVRADAQADFFIETPQAVRIKRERHQAFFAQFSSGAHVVTANSGHAIQLQEPELVSAAVEQVLDGARRNAQRLAQQQAKKVLMGELEKVSASLASGQAAAAESTLAAAIRASGMGEGQVNTLGFDVLTKGKQVELAAGILKQNARTYAQSHNAADSYGEALLAQGLPRDARLQFERALALGTAAKASERALAGYRANLSRAEAAIR
jgi:pimeloyl-ACP methyl ester carboxylesterase